MRFLLLAAAAIVLTVESPIIHAADPTPLKALPAIDPAAVLGHVKTLASDAFEGRAPGTPGEAKTVAYLVEAFRTLGLKPGNPDGTYVQKVPLVGITPAAAPLTITGGAAGRSGTGPAKLALARRRRGLDQAGDRRGQGRRVGAGVRRLRRPGAGVRLGRLQGRRRGRQDAGDAGQRSAGARPGIAVRRSTRRRSAAGP